MRDLLHNTIARVFYRDYWEAIQAMNAQEARKQAIENKTSIDKMTEQRVRDHILDAVRNGKLQVSLGYPIPTYFIETLKAEGYTVNKFFASVTISW